MPGDTPQAQKGKVELLQIGSAEIVDNLQPPPKHINLEDFKDLDDDDEGEDFEALLDIDKLRKQQSRTSVKSKEHQEIEKIINEQTEIRSSLDDSDSEEENFVDLKEKKGFLYKKSSSFLVGWQKRYFVLSNCRFCYYHNSTDTVPAGIFNFDKISAYIILDPEDKVSFSMFVEGLKREFKFKAYNEAERSAWTAEINKHIEKSKRIKSKDPRIVKEK